MITFTVSTHPVLKCEILEIFRNGKFIAAIYPRQNDDDGFKMLSSHLVNIGIAHNASTNHDPCDISVDLKNLSVLYFSLEEEPL